MQPKAIVRWLRVLRKAGEKCTCCYLGNVLKFWLTRWSRMQHGQWIVWPNPAVQIDWEVCFGNNQTTNIRRQCWSLSSYQSYHFAKMIRSQMRPTMIGSPRGWRWLARQEYATSYTPDLLKAKCTELSYSDYELWNPVQSWKEECPRLCRTRVLGIPLHKQQQPEVA